MARIAILVLIPIVALLAWRDLVLERQMRLLTQYETEFRSSVGQSQIAARDQRIDDAMWKLLLDNPKAALRDVDDVTRMPAPTSVPLRAWKIASAARCVLGQPPLGTYDDVSDARVMLYCSLRKK